MNWKIGDRAILCNVKNAGSVHNGDIVTVTSSPHMVCDLLIVDIEPIGNYGKWHRAAVKCLKPIPDTYDGNETTTWDQCDFKPAILVES